MFRFSKKPIQNREEGVTLLLSMLVLSVMAIVITTVGYFSIIELRASRGNTLTEPALIAAESSGEQAIWNAKRTGSLPPNCIESTSYTTLSGTTESARILQKKCSRFGPARFDLAPNQTIDIFIYDPNNINGNYTMKDALGRQLFDSFIVSMTGPYAITVKASTMDGVAVTGTQFDPTVTVTPVAPLTQVIPPTIIGSVDQRIQITITGSASAYSTVVVDVTSPPGVGYDGLPGFPTIDVEGCSSSGNMTSCNQTGTDIFRRRLNITLPL